MYHIVQDKRAIRSAEKVIQSLEETLINTSISDISVSRLCTQYRSAGRPSIGFLTI